MKHLFEIINYYKFSVAKAGIKNKIFAKIQDPIFLKENIIESNNSSSKLSPELYQGINTVLEIYEFETHLDKITTQIEIMEVNIEHSSEDIYN